MQQALSARTGSSRRSYNPTDLDSPTQQQLDGGGVQPESSPLTESSQQRVRIRDSLLPRDQQGRLRVRASVMEERAKVIVTDALDAIQISLQMELDVDVAEDPDIWDDLQRAWGALDSNQLYIFNFTRPPLFLSSETVAEDLELEGVDHLDLFEAVPSLKEALTLRNLANFLRILLEPDRAVHLLPEDPELIDGDHSQKLNLLFGHAWEALLQTCVPKSRWTSRAAISLLVDMATQRFIMGFGRWREFEQLDDEAIAELNAIFSDDAVRKNVYGVKELWRDGEADETLENLEREWQRATKIRMDMVSASLEPSDTTRILKNVLEQILSAKPEELDGLFPFNSFRHEIALQVSSFLQESEPLEGLLPAQHEALAAVVRERRNPDVDQDDAAVDLLTQTQHVSGRSEQDNLANFDSQQNQSQSQVPQNGTFGNSFPESIEVYESQVVVLDDRSDDELKPSDTVSEDGVSENEEAPEGTPETLNAGAEVDQNDVKQPEGEGEKGEEELEGEGEQEEEEEDEEKEEVEEVEEVEITEKEPVAVEGETSVMSNAQSHYEAVKAVIDLDEEETSETQQSWKIRKGKNGPLTTGDIVRGNAIASRLNVPQADAVRVEWDESQEPTQDGVQDEPRGTGVASTVSKTGKRAKGKQPATTADSESEEKEEEYQKAPVRQASRPVRTVRKAVNPSKTKALVSESEDDITSPGTGYSEDSESEEDDERVNRNRRGNASKPNPKALLGPSRTDVPVIHRTLGTKFRQHQREESAGLAASALAIAERKITRNGLKGSFMDSYVDNDLFMVDEDGQPLHDKKGRPLKEDPTYMEAVPNRTRPVVNGTRPPRLIWTEKDKLFLYREIQKCPINAASAYVSAVLHRYGDLNSTNGPDVFRLAHSMQLRDQMKDLVKLRSDRDLPIVGTARFFLPPADPRKQQFDAERMDAGKKGQADLIEEQRQYLEELRIAEAAKQQNGKRVADEELDEQEIENEIDVAPQDDISSDIQQEAERNEDGEFVQHDSAEQRDNGEDPAQSAQPALTEPEPPKEKRRVVSLYMPIALRRLPSNPTS
ncbi:hypothetical protein QFC19_008869 [Naganishia cerealis]|uniref:Uncharacterized protein n=1 Tax=Naganishia cerealis TaxID=610337 RepID=A0ACC2UZ31_9TREE|nr:hypothetical protein QFC19_008869 [Naganishia cerealis]